MKSKKEIIVGLFALASIITLYLGINYLKGVDVFHSENKYYAIYNNVEGLAVSNPVIYKGVEVGNVGSISLMKAHRGVLVEMYIHKNVRLGKDTKAVLVSNSLMGSKAIVLNMEEHIVMPLVSGDTLQSVVEEGITEVLKGVTIPLADKLDSILVEYQGTGLAVKKMVASFDSTSKNLNKILVDNQQQINTTMNGLASLTNSLNKNLLPNLNSISSKFDDVADSLKQAPLKELTVNLNQTLSEINSILKDINQGKGSVGQLVKNEDFYANINKSMKDLDSLLLDLKANPKRYVHFSVFGKK